MSKPGRLFYVLFVAPYLCLQIFTNGAGQALEAVITVHPETPVIDVKGRFIDTSAIKNPRNFSFARDAAGVGGLGGRIRAVELVGSNGEPIGYRKLIDGEFLADADIA